MRSCHRSPLLCSRILVGLFICVWTITTTTASSSSSSTATYNPPPISLQSGINKHMSTRLESASNWATLEQIVEDCNAHLVAVASSPLQAMCARRLICLPLDERFDPPMGVFSHGHVQTGDKMSLPKIFWNAIQTSGAEVPWLFEVTPCQDTTILQLNEPRPYSKTKEEDDDDEDEEKNDKEEDVSTNKKKKNTHEDPVLLDRVVGGALDFRAPSNYIFLPWWMMRAMGLSPRDVVDVRLIENVPPGSAVQLRPHTSKFASEIANPQAVLETELKHYSALTKGSSIAFDYNHQRYWFDVVDLRSSPRGERVPWVKVQDCDIAAEFVPAKDVMKNKQKKKNSSQQEK